MQTQPAVRVGFELATDDIQFDVIANPARLRLGWRWATFQGLRAEGNLWATLLSVAYMSQPLALPQTNQNTQTSCCRWPSALIT